MFAPRLLVSPDLVPRGPAGAPCGPPADGYTERDIARIAQLAGSHHARAAGVWLSRPRPDHAGYISGGQGDSTGQHGSVPGRGTGAAEQQAGTSAHRTATPGSPPRYTRGLPEVHARYVRLPAPRLGIERSVTAGLATACVISVVTRMNSGPCCGQPTASRPETIALGSSPPYLPAGY